MFVAPSREEFIKSVNDEKQETKYRNYFAKLSPNDRAVSHYIKIKEGKSLREILSENGL